jgi:hypothetical protein
MSLSSRIVTTFAAVVALTPAVAVHAQDVELVARVPFEFTVGNTTLPRAAYQLSRLDAHPEMLLVRSERRGVLVRTQEIRLARRTTAPSLLFHRYGDQYFLREIRLDGSERLDLPETAGEREAADGRADRASAGLETVVIPVDRR